MSAWMQGYRAAYFETETATNPYDPSTVAFDEWANGFVDGLNDQANDVPWSDDWAN